MYDVYSKKPIKEGNIKDLKKFTIKKVPGARVVEQNVKPGELKRKKKFFGRNGRKPIKTYDHVPKPPKKQTTAPKTTQSQTAVPKSTLKAPKPSSSVTGPKASSPKIPSRSNPSLSSTLNSRTPLIRLSSLSSVSSVESVGPRTITRTQSEPLQRSSLSRSSFSSVNTQVTDLDSSSFLDRSRERSLRRNQLLNFNPITATSQQRYEAAARGFTGNALNYDLKKIEAKRVKDLKAIGLDAQGKPLKGTRLHGRVNGSVRSNNGRKPIRGGIKRPATSGGRGRFGRF